MNCCSISVLQQSLVFACGAMLLLNGRASESKRIYDLLQTVGEAKRLGWFE